MNEKESKHISKFLSLVLRHAPETINLSLDQNGWAEVDELLQKCNEKEIIIDLYKLKFVVENNDKKRFIFNEDDSKIRANQGHSIQVELELKPKAPPTLLYHGTVQKFLDSIKKEGLQKMSRQHVHLSSSEETAEVVAKRRGKPIILKVDSGKMYQDGHLFYFSENGVWLTNDVPSKYIDL